MVAVISLNSVAAQVVVAAPLPRTRDGQNRRGGGLALVSGSVRRCSCQGCPPQLLMLLLQPLLPGVSLPVILLLPLLLLSQLPLVLSGRLQHLLPQQDLLLLLGPLCLQALLVLLLLEG